MKLDQTNPYPVFGLAGSATALIGECITVDIFQRTGSRSVASAAVFFLFLHIFLFGLSYDATSYVYGSEIFPNPVRARGMGISVTGMFVSTIIFLQCAPTAFAEIGWKYYTVFIALSTVMFVIMWLYFPEVRSPTKAHSLLEHDTELTESTPKQTKGKALEDVAEVFGDEIVLEEEVEVIHRRFKESHYREDALADIVEEKRAAFIEIEGTTNVNA